jgi:membrane protein
MVRWLDRLQQRSRAVGFVIAVVYKYVDDQGGYLAALITYYAFVSVLPLLLLLTTGVGVVLAGHPGLQHEVVTSTLNQFPVIGSQLEQPQELSGGVWAVVVGVLGALYGGSGVGQAIQNAMDSVWAVPRHKRPDPLRLRLRSLLMLGVLALAAITSTVVSAVGHAVDSLGFLSSSALVLVSIAINAAICAVLYKLTTARPLGWAQVAPGAFAAAVIWQLLQWFGATYVSRVVRSASATNSVFAIVLGMLAFLFLVSVTLVMCAEMNAVRVDQLHPRALLSPFTDNVHLTAADRAFYTSRAKAEQLKGFQRIFVRFDRGKKTPASSPTDTTHP